MISIAGASRMSSVPGLKARSPHGERPTVEEIPVFAANLVQEHPFLHPVDVQSRSGRAQIEAAALAQMEQRGQVLRKARTPKPVPGTGMTCRFASPPDPVAKMPDVGAHTLRRVPAISFMNEMRTASMAFAAYLVSSALAVSMTRILSSRRMNGAYMARRSARASGSSPPRMTPIGAHEVLDGGPPP